MAIETTSSSVSPPSPSVFETQAQRPRPLDVGILGIEMYFPRRVSYLSSPFLSCLLITS
jgi:hydroxymethylglutaryl-CoA synthase